MYYFDYMDKVTIAQIRSFNRFYVKILGLLEKYLHNSNFNLIEARIIYEIYNQKEVTSSGLIKDLGIDKGYMSRIVKKLDKKGILKRVNSFEDKRYFHLSLTDRGVEEYLKLNEASDIQIEHFIRSLEDDQKQELIAHMNAIKGLLLKPNS